MSDKFKLGESAGTLIEKLNELADEFNSSGYTLPVATSSELGGIKTGYKTSGKNYKVDTDDNGNAYVNVPWSDADTKNTAGSTNSTSKLFLIGATSQAANPQTYSRSTAYVGTDGKLYSGGKVVYASGDSIPEAYLTWGGKNSAGSYAPIDAAMIPALGANRLAFMPAAGVTIEYSQDGGTTWAEYSTTDSAKINLFNGIGSSYIIGGSTATKVNKAAHMLRITIETSTANVYTILNKFAIYISSNGSTGSYCTITGRTQANYTNGVDAWTTFVDQQGIAGWSGWNIINTSLTTYGNQSTHYRQVRFTFGVTSHDETVAYAGLTVTKILGFGGVGWKTPSTLAASGNIYSYDYLQNVTFPSGVSAKSFTENGTTLENKYQAKGNYLTGITKSQVTTALGYTPPTSDDINTAIANLVDSAPDALNTLNELAEALGDDPNFATTITNSLSGKLGKTEKAVDSAKLNGQEASYYLNYNNLLNKPTIPSVYSLPLAASGTRGGVQIGYTESGANIPLQLSSEKAYVALTSNAVISALTYTPADDNAVVKLAGAQTITGAKTYTGNQTFKNNYFEVKANSNTDDSWIKMTNSTDAGYYAFGIRRPYANYGLQMKYHPADSSGDKYYKIWNEDNDGEGSGLDADKLDGQQGSYYTGYTDTAIAGLSSVYQPKGNYLGVSEKAQSAVVADSASAVHWDNVTNKPASYYTLPTASSSTLGGVKTGSNITNTSGTISLSKDNVTTALGYTPVNKAGDTLSDGATLKFSTYGTRFITISGNSISADMSNETGGWAGNFASVKDPSGATTSMLGWYGGATGLTHIYMGGSYDDPFMKFTSDGQFTFKKTPKVGTASLALASEVSTALSTAKSYTDTAVAGLVNSAPDALNTLKELSTALGDDPNFATTVANQIGGKLGKTEKAADSDKLDGQDGSYYLNYNNLTNKPDIPPAYSLPLAANGTRGGIQIGYTASGANIPVQLSSEKAYVALTSTAVTSALGYTPASTSYYWANVGISSTSNDNTTPTFNPAFKVKLTNNLSLAPANDGSNAYASPIPKYLWHDLLGFGINGEPTVETSTNGTTWTETTDATLKKKLFINREDQTVSVIKDSQPYIRWTWYNTQFHACQASWVAIGFAYATPVATNTITMQTSNDGKTWTTVCEKSLAGNQAPYWFKINSGWSSQYYFRITFQRTSASGTLTNISGIKLLTARWGNQGRGSEYEYPYAWDENSNIYRRNTTQTLGTASQPWAGIYGTTLYEGGTSLANKYQAKGSYLTGITKSQVTTALGYTPPSSLSDLGITATATELNYVDGVTSNIQTQLNGKLSTTGKAASATVADSASSVAWENITGKPPIINPGDSGVGRIKVTYDELINFLYTAEGGERVQIFFPGYPELSAIGNNLIVDNCSICAEQTIMRNSGADQLDYLYMIHYKIYLDPGCGYVEILPYTLTPGGSDITLGGMDSFDLDDWVCEFYILSENSETIDTTYTLPVASSDTLGGIKTGYTASGANIPLQLSSEKAYVALTKTAVTSALGYTPLNKTTYEWNEEITFGGVDSGKSLLIGKFPCYDTNLTVEIKSTTNTTYYGRLIIATQNVNVNAAGTVTANVYGDATNTLASAITVVRDTLSNRNISIYFTPADYSKHIIHVQAVALAGTPTEILTKVASVPSVAGGAYSVIKPTNTLTANFQPKGSYASPSDVSTALSTAKSYADTAVAGLVDSSPETLNTLNELAAALGDDPNFATTVATQIGGKLSTSGGTVTGNILFSNSNAQGSQPNLKWATINSKTPYVGYCTASTDGTFLIGSLAGTSYTTGLSIGGSSGNLLWKGTRVATTADIPAAYTLPAASSTTLGGVKVGSNITVNSGTISLSKDNVTTALGYTPPTTNTTYSVATASTAGLVKPVSVITKPTLNSVTTTAGKYYQVQMSNDGNMFVNVPWEAGSTSSNASTVSVTDTTPTSATTYYSLYSTGKSGNQTVRANKDLYFYDGGSYGYFNVGSSDSIGGLTLHYSNGKYVNLATATTLTANRSIYLPDADGTIITTGNFPTASSTTLGGVKTTSTVTSTSGLTACPIIGGVPYYKDTNTTTFAASAITSGSLAADRLPSAVKGSAVGNSNTTTNGGTKGAVRIVVKDGNLYIYTGSNA